MTWRGVKAIRVPWPFYRWRNRWQSWWEDSQELLIGWWKDRQRRRKHKKDAARQKRWEESTPYAKTPEGVKVIPVPPGELMDSVVRLHYLPALQEQFERQICLMQLFYRDRRKYPREWGRPECVKGNRV